MVLPNTLKEIKTTRQKLFVYIVNHAPYSEVHLIWLLRICAAVDIKLLQPRSGNNFYLHLHDHIHGMRISDTLFSDFAKVQY